MNGLHGAIGHPLLMRRSPWPPAVICQRLRPLAVANRVEAKFAVHFRRIQRLLMSDPGRGRLRVRSAVAPHARSSIRKWARDGRAVDCSLPRAPRKRLQIFEDPCKLVRPLLVLRDELRHLIIYGPREGIEYRVSMIRSELDGMPVAVLILMLQDRKHHGG